MNANFAKRRRIKSPRGLDADVKIAVEGNFHLDLKNTKTNAALKKQLACAAFNLI